MFYKVLYKCLLKKKLSGENTRDSFLYSTSDFIYLQIRIFVWILRWIALYSIFFFFKRSVSLSIWTDHHLSLYIILFFCILYANLSGTLYICAFYVEYFLHRILLIGTFRNANHWNHYYLMYLLRMTYSYRIRLIIIIIFVYKGKWFPPV